MNTKLVVHCKRAPFDVYIGRPGPWGNPFSHLPKAVARFRCASREEAIDRYAEWFLLQPALVAKAKRELRGKILGCWCAPLECHGHVLADVANDDRDYAVWAAEIRTKIAGADLARTLKSTWWAVVGSSKPTRSEEE